MRACVEPAASVARKSSQAEGGQGAKFSQCERSVFSFLTRGGLGNGKGG